LIENSKERKRVRHYVYPVIAVGLGIFVAGVLGEGILRAFSPNWLEYRMAFLNAGNDITDFGSDRNWKFQARHGRFLKFTPNSSWDVSSSEYFNRANIDELGGRQVSGESIAGQKHIVPFLGDSFTFGVGVDDRQTFASLYSAKLNAQARIINLGVPGTALYQQLFIVSERHEELSNPRAYVFFFFLGNDFADLLKEKPFWHAPRAPQHQAVPTFAQPTAAQYGALQFVNGLVFHNRVAKRSYLIQFLRAVALQIYLKGRPTNVNPVFMMMDRDNAAYTESARHAVRVALTKLREMEERYRFAATLVAIPDVYQVVEARRVPQAEYYGIDTRRLDPWLPNAVLKSEARRANIKLIDPSICIAKSADKVDLYYMHDNHFTAPGHAAFFACTEKLLLPWIEQHM
jgi:hypothetical protein